MRVFSGKSLKLFEEFDNALSPVRFNDAHHDILAAFMAAYGFAEHIVGLANTWSIPQEELEDSSILL
jgi:hypothetical protein